MLCMHLILYFFAWKLCRMSLEKKRKPKFIRKINKLSKHIFKIMCTSFSSLIWYHSWFIDPIFNIMTEKSWKKTFQWQCMHKQEYNLELLSNSPIWVVLIVIMSWVMPILMIWKLYIGNVLMSSILLGRSFCKVRSKSQSNSTIFMTWH